MTLTEVYEDVAAILAAAPFSFRRSPSVFDERTVPDVVEHLAFMLAPGNFTPRYVSGATEWKLGMELRVIYFPRLLDQATLISATILGHVQGIVAALRGKEYVGVGEWAGAVRPAEDEQSVILHLVIPVEFCENVA